MDNNWIPLAGSGQGFVRSDLQKDFVSAGLRTVADFWMLKGETITTPGMRKRSCARLQLGEQTVFLKRYECESVGERLRRCWEDGKWRAGGARETWAAEELARDGISTPQPIAWGVEGARSFVMFEKAAGEQLDYWLENNPLSWDSKKRLVQQLAALTRKFHGKRWRHRDLYLCHYFVARTGEGFELSLIDLHRVFRPHYRAARWQIKDLAAIHYSAMPRIFSRAMRMRFVHAYFGCHRLGRAEKNFLRQILRRTRVLESRTLPLTQ